MRRCIQEMRKKKPPLMSLTYSLCLPVSFESNFYSLDQINQKGMMNGSSTRILEERKERERGTKIQREREKKKKKDDQSIFF